MKNEKRPHIRVTDHEVVAGEILLVLDAYHVPACFVDDVFAKVKEQITLQPVTIGAAGLTKVEADRRKADMRRRFGLLKKRRMK